MTGLDQDRADGHHKIAGGYASVNNTSCVCYMVIIMVCFLVIAALIVITIAVVVITASLGEDMLDMHS